MAIEPERASAAYDEAWSRHMQLWASGVASGAKDVAHWALADLGVSPHGELLAPVVERFEEASHSSSVVALEQAAATLERITSTGVRCAVICDTGLTPGRVVRRHLEHVGLLRYFEVQIFSDEWSIVKPDARIFHAALEALGVSASSAVHVGDLKRTDVAGARSVGMRTVRIRLSHDDLDDLPDADHVIDSHAELPALLGLVEGNGDRDVA